VRHWDAGALWDEVCKRLKALLHPDVFSKWIAVIRPERLEERTLLLAVEDPFYQTWLEENYLPFIRQAVQSAAGAELTVRFTVKPPEPKPEPPASPLAPRSGEPDSREPTLFPLPAPAVRPREKARPSPSLAIRSASSSLNEHFQFDTFVVGPSNSFAHAACVAVAQAPAKAYNPLFIYGNSGLGKTHLMQAIGHYVLAHGRSPRVCYVSSEAFINEFIDALQNNQPLEFRRRYRGMDLLLIDDIHFLAGKERLQEEFFHTFNALFNAHKQIVMTSDRPANQIQGLEQRLVSRFEWGLVTELQPPDFETRLAILRNKQQRAAITLPESVLEFIASRIKSNIRPLEGALTRVISYVSLYRAVPPQEKLEALLRDLLEEEAHQALTLEGIQKAVAEYYDVRMADMSSKRRPQAVAHPRQVAMYLCRRLTQSSFPEIANAFGKTHATVLHACSRIESRLSQDPTLRKEITDIAQRLGRRELAF
jgi:chromosomal replication initiator protein